LQFAGNLALGGVGKIRKISRLRPKFPTQRIREFFSSQSGILKMSSELLGPESLPRAPNFSNYRRATARYVDPIKTSAKMQS
jgi:hypothetical protein